MRLGLTPSYTANLKQNNAPKLNFRGSDDNKITMTKEELKTIQHDNLTRGVIVGSLLATSLTGISTATLTGVYNCKEKADGIKNFITILNDKYIKKDSFMVKDVNKDDVPEIIFEKKAEQELHLISRIINY